MRQTMFGFTFVETLIALLVGMALWMGIFEMAGFLAGASAEAGHRVQARAVLADALERTGGLPFSSAGSDIPEASLALAAALLPGGRVTVVPACPRWSGLRCLVVAWSDEPAETCTRPNVLRPWREPSCLGAPW